uniref:Phospholipid scramblase n=1 Tax=Ciona savignyi TaxID=51511 RepID=H2ZPC5_CIOSA
MAAVHNTQPQYGTTNNSPSNQGTWMDMPPSVPGCPAGLEYLTQLDQVLVHQQVELFEAMTDFETKNRYVIKNSLGQQCYFAKEESSLFQRLCCGSERGFEVKVTDNNGQEVIRMRRRFKCCAGCCWCANSDTCAFFLEVESPTGTFIGGVRQSQSCWYPMYEVMDASQKSVFNIEGPCCPISGPCCTCDFDFVVSTTDDSATPVGKITKQYSGFVKEAFTNATNFSVTFPMDLDVKMKAVLLGASLLIDFMYFEENQDNDS